MSLVEISITLIALFCALNLFITYGVIRRLRLHGERFTQQGFTSDLSSHSAITKPFTVKAINGRKISDETLRGSRIVAFFSPGCPPCEDLLPKFAEVVAKSGIDREQALAAICSDEDGEGEKPYIETLTPISTVLIRDQALLMASAIGVRGYPFVCQVDSDGLLIDLGRDERKLWHAVAG